MTKKKKLIILGASGHGGVLLDLALLCEYEVLGFLDDNPKTWENGGYPVLGSIEKVKEYYEIYGDSLEFIIGIGANEVRKRIDKEQALPWATLIHPTAVVGRQVVLGEGTVVMANAVINPCASIGRHCIVNTASVIEHDDVIADYVHISVGAKLGGTVSVGEQTWVGIGAVVNNNISVYNRCIIGAGAVVVKDIKESGTYVGVPARKIK